MDVSIGLLSQKTGVKIPTIRYYETVGLLPKPARTDGRQRRYSASDISKLNFIRHARELGFDIDSIRELLVLNAQPDQPCADADDLTRRHLADVDRRISQLVSLRDELQRMLATCGHGRVGECRVIQALADHGQCASEHRQV